MNVLKLTRNPLFYLTVFVLGVSALLMIPMQRAVGLTYGTGGYGNCQYNTCGITMTLSSGGIVQLNTTPTKTGSCTVKKESATITTGSDTGYTLLLQDTDTNNSLIARTGETIPSVTGTVATPVTLSADTWGFRVDGIGGFGPGPTSEASNASIPSSLYAGLPLSSQVAATISQTAASTPSTGVVTDVFYGACISTSKRAATYSNDVTYTAIVN